MGFTSARPSAPCSIAASESCAHTTPCRVPSGTIIDGDSRVLLNIAVLPNKEATTVYQELLLPALQLWGFPDQLNTDQGNEWCVDPAVAHAAPLTLAMPTARRVLCIFVCFYIWYLNGRAQPGRRMPHKIVPSTSNTRAERFNFEPNMRGAQ